jgi:probable rRNA maturation factor
MFSIHKTIKGSPLNLPFLKIKEFVLGKKYDLSLIFIGSTRSKNLNKTYRRKNKPANILSFPLSEDEGEIFIDIKESRVIAKKFGSGSKNFTYSERRQIGFLFIHGLLHLKGFAHSSKMEVEEEKIKKQFNL